MQCILERWKLSRNWLVEIGRVTTGWLRVSICYIGCWPTFNHLPTALAGASATIASDALMNPFDGMVGLLCAFVFLTHLPYQSLSNGCKYTSLNFVRLSLVPVPYCATRV